MKKTNKRGFTIVELVIVIAVIAILAAVLIPTFSSVIKKAQTSADVQACRQMNEYLAINEITEGKTVFDVYDALAEGGMNADHYKPLVSDMYYFWDADLNRILYVNDTNTVVYPDEYKGKTQSTIGSTAHTWLSLGLEIATSTPASYANNSNAISATVSTAAEYAYVIEQYNKATAGTTLDLTVNETLDLMGASAIIKETHGAVNIHGTGTIKNITSNKFINASTTNSTGVEAKYCCGGVVGIAKHSVTFEGVTFENINVRGLDVGNIGIIVGQAEAGGSCTFNNITVKNSTVIGQRGVGALIGQASGAMTIDLKGNITLDNVQVLTTGGRSALLIGLMCGNSEVLKIDKSATLSLINGTKHGICYDDRMKQVIVDKGVNYGGVNYGVNSSIAESDKMIYAVKTFNNDGTIKEYSLYGYCEDALVLKNETTSSWSDQSKVVREHTTNGGYGAYLTFDELKTAFGYDAN